MYYRLPIFVFVASALARFVWRSLSRPPSAFLPASKKPALTLKALQALRKISAHP